MKSDVYKNKKPRLVKFFQITTLLIGSAFFTAQADFPAPNEKFFDSSRTVKTDTSIRFRHPIFLLGDEIWLPNHSNSSCYRRFELFIYDPNNLPDSDDENSDPYQIFVAYDNRKVSFDKRGNTGGFFPLVPFISLAPFSGYHPTPDGSVVDAFEIDAKPPSDPNYDENGVPLLGGTTHLAAFGTRNGVPLNIDIVELELPYYWYPICQI